jgi:hypothetical protein
MLTSALNLTPQAGRFFAKHTAQKSVQLAPLFMRALCASRINLIMESKMDLNLITGSVAFLFGILSAKWAMELGYSQFTQIILFCVGLILGPLVLFVLYIRLLYLRKENNQPGTKFFGYQEK